MTARAARRSYLKLLRPPTFATARRTGAVAGDARVVERADSGVQRTWKTLGRIGRSIAQGNGFGNSYGVSTGPTSWEPPLYPYLIGAFSSVFVFTAVFQPLCYLRSAGLFCAHLYSHISHRMKTLRPTDCLLFRPCYRFIVSGPPASFRHTRR
jgi:hypothetical protein